jgi:formylglycine-generating enzyme required for sulfatase activity
VKDRLDFALTVEERSIDDYQKAWDLAIASIANEEECPRYKGLIIKSQIGFVPIDRDPNSELWEFAHLQTGEIPKRRADGKLILTEEMGLVFVLIPGGTFNMGAVKPSADHPMGSPNVDPRAMTREEPVHTNTIKPFFMSKYEMTQGQWLRFTGKNPSWCQAGKKYGGKTANLLHPVDKVSWVDCTQVLFRLRLRLPSEAEWEYATRAGTTTVFWTGDDKKSLEGAVNIVDFYSKTHAGSPAWDYEEWLDDGYSNSAPVGSYFPNPFGLHDVHGNVWEWCQDSYLDSYKSTTTDGSAFESRDSVTRVYRGGAWIENAWACRSSIRGGADPEYRNSQTGIRPACTLQE